MGRNNNEKQGIIYLVTNRVTGRKYIGCSKRTLIIRWDEHWKSAESGKGWALHAAIRKYGKDNFTPSILVTAPLCSLEQLEVFFIYLHGSFTDGYNMTRGGDGVPVTDAMRKKMSESGLKKPPMTNETRRRRSIAQTGKKQSPEQCAANGDRKRGLKHSPEHIAKRVASLKENEKNRVRKPISEETRTKMSLAKKDKPAPRVGWKHSDETKQAISISSKTSPLAIANREALAISRRGKPSPNRGTTASDETRTKLSLAKKGRPWTEAQHAAVRARREAKAALRKAA